MTTGQIEQVGLECIKKMGDVDVARRIEESTKRRYDACEEMARLSKLGEPMTAADKMCFETLAEVVLALDLKLIQIGRERIEARDEFFVALQPYFFGLS